MIRAILFDLDGNLLDRDASIKHFIAHQYDRFPAELAKIAKPDYINRFIELDCRGYVWKDKVYQTLVREFGIEAHCLGSLLLGKEKISALVS
ncbi:HAD-superfamily hydrolase [Nostoc carneum NIES-2107]|nr:HAD-superfamily hydrolase [Nostoc carneum NIES-2107]